MKIFKYIFLVLVLAVTIVPTVQTAFADECQKVVYDSTGAATYTPASCSPTTACPSYASVAGTYPCSAVSATGLLGIVNKVFTTMFIILVTAASFALLYAAFLYVTSEGEQEKVKNAKNIIIYAVVALIIAALAFGAPRAIQSFITG